ncbi:MAG: mechanosensitive ion channel family protein [Xanthomonadales bacterium]
MDITEKVLLGNDLPEWAIAVGMALLAVIVLRTAQGIVRGRIARLAQRTDTRWDDHVVNVIASTRLLFWLVVGAWFGAQYLELPDSGQRWVGIVFVITLLLQAGLWGGALVNSVLNDYRKRKREENPEDLTTLGMIGLAARVVVWSVVVLLILDNLGIDITALVAGLGIGGVAVALAVQNILGDLFSSLSIVLDKPFVVGDFLMVGDFLGSVEKIGLKTTRLRSLSGEELIFSNTDLLNSRVRNFGRMAERRVVFKLGVVYQTPREKLKLIPQIIREAIEAQQDTRFDRSHFSQYGDFSLNFESVYYVLSRDYNQYMDIQQSIYLAIHERFEAEHIEFAYPTQTVFLERPDTD